MNSMCLGFFNIENFTLSLFARLSFITLHCCGPITPQYWQNFFTCWDCTKYHDPGTTQYIVLYFKLHMSIDIFDTVALNAGAVCFQPMYVMLLRG